MNFDETIERLKHFEGFRSHAYRCTAGKLTIGYGTMIELPGRGLDEDEAELILRNDLVQIEDDLVNRPWFRKLNARRQEAIVEMAYQLGIAGLMGFQRMISALVNDDYETAYREALDSKWAQHDTPARAAHVAMRIRGQ